MSAVAPMARYVGKSWGKFTSELRRRVDHTEDINGLCYGFINSPHVISWMIIQSHGKAGSRETHIPCAAERVNEKWFAYHSARVDLALVCVFLKKYGLSNAPGKKLPNTYLDTNYLALLHYADALASDETSGDMAEMCRWLYNNTKKIVSSRSLLSQSPSEPEIRRAAYEEWERTRRTHGHDLADWYKAESDRYGSLWAML